MNTVTSAEVTHMPVTTTRLLAPRDIGASRARVLVVEHDEAYRRALHAALTKVGFDVLVAVDVLDGIRRFTAEPPDVVLLEVLLPGVSAAEACRRMRAVAHVPVIMVAAEGATFDAVQALQLDASDYLTKPYRLRELVSRIEAVRRAHAAGTSPPPAPPVDMDLIQRRDVISVGGIRVDFGRRRVHRDNREIHLPRKEFDLLAILLTPPGQLRSRRELLGRLWSGQLLDGSRTLDTHVRRLRLKLEAAPKHPRHLITVRGIGYRFDIDPIVEAAAHV
jgi:two-component system response regulator RegX3